MGDLRTVKKETTVGISSILHDPLRNEANRRDTFKQNINQPLTDLEKQLAAKGFYLPHLVPNKVQCFSCGVRLDYPLQFCGHRINSEHRKLNPECDFLQEIEASESLERVITSTSGPSGSCNNSSRPRPTPNNTHCCCPSPENSSVSMSSRNTTSTTQVHDRCVTSRRNSPAHTVMEQASRMIIADNANSRNEMSNVYNNRAAVNYDLMKSEAERLKTFSVPPVWSTSFIHPADCAHAGFFFLHDGDKVQCAFCRGVAGEWEQGDEPWSEHRKHFPRCPFICNLPVGNIPRTQPHENGTMDASSSGSGSSTISDRSVESESDESVRGIDVCGPYTVDQMRGHGLTNSRTITLRGAQPLSGNLDDVATNLSIRPCRGPCNKNMVTEQSRIKSFKHPNWSSSTQQNPEKLAEAGYYYIGCEDHVKCFYCGGGLRNWEGGEDPWVEHAKWFPRCTFLHLNKGDHFIESVTAKGSKSNTLSPCGSGSSDEEEPSNSVSPPSETEPLSGVERISKPSDEASSSGNSSGDEELSVSKDLEDEVRKLREARVCKICMDKEVSVVFLPCGHLISCTSCATAFSNCALCRQPIKAVVRTYMS